VRIDIIVSDNVILTQLCPYLQLHDGYSLDPEPSASITGVIIVIFCSNFINGTGSDYG